MRASRRQKLWSEITHRHCGISLKHNLSSDGWIRNSAATFAALRPLERHSERFLFVILRIARSLTS